MRELDMNRWLVKQICARWVKISFTTVIHVVMKLTIIMPQCLRKKDTQLVEMDYKSICLRSVS
jgi:hypothetical protein